MQFTSYITINKPSAMLLDHLLFGRTTTDNNEDFKSDAFHVWRLYQHSPSLSQPSRLRNTYWVPGVCGSCGHKKAYGTASDLRMLKISGCARDM